MLGDHENDWIKFSFYYPSPFGFLEIVYSILIILSIFITTYSHSTRDISFLKITDYQLTTEIE